MRGRMTRRGLLSALPAILFGGWLGRRLRPAGPASPPVPGHAPSPVYDPHGTVGTFVYDWDGRSTVIYTPGRVTTFTYDPGPARLATAPPRPADVPLPPATPAPGARPKEPPTGLGPVVPGA